MECQQDCWVCIVIARVVVETQHLLVSHPLIQTTKEKNPDHWMESVNVVGCFVATELSLPLRNEMSCNEGLACHHCANVYLIFRRNVATLDFRSKGCFQTRQTSTKSR